MRNNRLEVYEVERMSMCMELQKQIDSYTVFIESTPVTEGNRRMVQHARDSRAAHMLLCAQINGLSYEEKPE